MPFCTKSIISLLDFWGLHTIGSLFLLFLWVHKFFDITSPPSLSCLKLHLFSAPLYWTLPSRFRSCFKAVLEYPDFIWYLVDTFSVVPSQLVALKMLPPTVCLALLHFPLYCHLIDPLIISSYVHIFFIDLSPAFWRMGNHQTMISWAMYPKIYIFAVILFGISWWARSFYFIWFSKKSLLMLKTLWFRLLSLLCISRHLWI